MTNRGWARMGDLPVHGQESSPALRIAPWPMALSSQSDKKTSMSLGFTVLAILSLDVRNMFPRAA